MMENYFEILLSQGDFELSVSYEFSAGSCLGIYGESGSGKSTLLRCLAGLDHRVKGNFCFSGEWFLQDDIEQVPAEHRAVSLCFQESKLFPHLSVDNNLRFSERRAHKNFEGFPDRKQILKVLNLEGLLHEFPRDLSGGQKKRVALAQAILARPRLLLLDEALAFLDSQSQKDFLSLLEVLLATKQLTIFYVSHDMQELCSLCEDMIILKAGEVVFSGTVQEALIHQGSPLLQGNNPFVSLKANFMAYDEEYGISEFKSEQGQRFFVLSEHTAGESVQLRIEANNVSLALVKEGAERAGEVEQELSVLNQLNGVVEAVLSENKQSLLLLLDCGGDKIISKISRLSFGRMQLCEGKRVKVLMKAASINEF